MTSSVVHCSFANELVFAELDTAIEKELSAVDPKTGSIPASTRMKQGQHAALHRRLKLIMEEYNGAITDFEDKSKNKMKRAIANGQSGQSIRP